MSGSKKKFDTGALDAQSLKSDKVFRAISDINRRHILMIIKEKPGVTMTEICDHFPVSRFAIIKHLNILEDCGLIRREQEGSFKRLFMNPEPLDQVISSWAKQMIEP